MKLPSKPSGKIHLPMALHFKVDLKPDEWSLWSRLRPLLVLQKIVSSDSRTAYYTTDLHVILAYV